MGPETIVGQLRPTMTEHYIKEKQTSGSSFADAWENMFGSLEYTAVMNTEVGTEITIDWQDGTESNHSAAVDRIVNVSVFRRAFRLAHRRPCCASGSWSFENAAEKMSLENEDETVSETVIESDEVE